MALYKVREEIGSFRGLAMLLQNLLIHRFNRLHMDPVGHAGHDDDFGVGFEFGECLLEQSDRAFEIERVLFPGEDVQLSGEFGAKCRPVAFENEVDVVLFPRVGDGGVDGPGLAIEEPFGQAVGAAFAEYGFEGLNLTTRTEDGLSLNEVLIVERHLILAARERAARAVGFAEQVACVGVEIDALKVSKVDGVGAVRPTAVEQFRVSDLQPKRAPSAGRNAGHVAVLRFARGAKAAFNFGDEFFGESSSPGAVGVGVGENAVAVVAGGVRDAEKDFVGGRVLLS